MSEYQKLFFAFSIILIAISFTFKIVITGDKVFATPDSQSAAAVGQGIEKYKSEFGQYPKWNPWIFSGVPTTHSLQHVSRYYPPFYIFKALNNIGMPKFFNYLIHFIFLGIGTFLILYRKNINIWACLYSGLAFTLMPYIITMIVHGHGSQMMTAAYIPWIFLFIEKLREKRSVLNISILSLLIGFQLLRGHVQIAYYTWLIIGSYILLYMISDIKSKQLIQNKEFYLFSIISLVVGFLSSLQLYYPAHSYSPFSIRGGSDGGTGFDYATAWSFSFGEMLTFINPNYYGFGGSTYWGNMPFTDYPNYMSIISIVLTIYAILFVKSSIVQTLLFIWISALFLSFGNNTPIYKIFYNYFPFFNKFRVPTMFLVVLQFSTILLSGIGFNYLLKNKLKDFKNYFPFIFTIILLILSQIFGASLLNNSGKTHQVLDSMRLNMMNDGFISSFIFVILFLFLFFLLNKNLLKFKIFAPLVLCLLIIDLNKVNSRIIHPKDKYNKTKLTMSNRDFKSLHKVDEIIQFLKSDNSNFRVLPLPPLLNDNRWSAFNIQNVGGYHPAKLQNYQTLMADIGFNSPGYLQMLNVKYLISLNEINHPMFERVFKGRLNHQGQSVDAFIYLNKFDTNSIYFPKDINNYKNEDELISVLKNPYYTLVNTAYLKDSKIQGLNGAGEIIDFSFSPDQIKVKIEMKNPGIIVFSEIYYPNGWKCFVNKNPVEIFEVNGLLRGIYLKKGKHDIKMIFMPKDLKLSRIISNITFLFIFIGIIFGYIKDRN